PCEQSLHGGNRSLALLPLAAHRREKQLPERTLPVARKESYYPFVSLLYFCQLVTANCVLLSNDSVRSNKHLLRNRQTDLFGGLQVDDELKLRRLFHREIGGLGAFQYLVDVRSGAPIMIQGVDSVGDEPSCVYSAFPGEHRW